MRFEIYDLTKDNCMDTPFSTLGTIHFTKDTNTYTVQYYVQYAGPPCWQTAKTVGPWVDESTLS